MTQRRRAPQVGARDNAPGRVMVAIGATLLLVGCGATAPADDNRHNTVTVTVKNVSFSPSEVHIHPGDEVTWAYEDGGTFHDVEVGGLAAAPGFRRDGTFSAFFPDPGTYAVTCTIHPQMTGTVIVEP